MRPPGGGRGPVPVEGQIPQVDVPLSPRQDVRQGPRHLGGPPLGGLTSRGRIGAVQGGHRENPTRGRLDPIELDPPVQVGRPARRAPEDPVLDQHAAGDGGGRLDLALRHDPAVGAPRGQAPVQDPVGHPQAVDASVAAAEEDPPLVKGRRRIHPGPGREAPG